LGILILFVASGCGHKHKSLPPSVTEPPNVRLTRPAVRTIVRVVGQPSFVESYERSSVYPKLSGYIKEWTADIGDKVKKNDTLCTLFVPELEEDFETKKATVQLDKEKVYLARTLVDVAAADVEAAEARLDETKAILDQYEAQVDRWDSEVKRLTREVKTGVIDPQVLLESQNQLKSSTASRDAAVANIKKAEANLKSQKASLAESKVDVKVAEAQVAVAESDCKRIEAWVGYLQLPAPFDGVIVARNANTYDFVLPATGDPSADHNAPHLSPSTNAAPIYVVDRTDVVRVFVDIPEHDANYVKAGTKANVLIHAFRDRQIPATVTRTSWALNVKSRTLRAEIDLQNIEIPVTYNDLGTHQLSAESTSNAQILPGMYAYGKVIIERPNVLALPVSALTHIGEKTYYWTYKDGKAAQTEIQTGVSDGEWIEVTNRQNPSTDQGEEPWAPIDGSEKVILGDLSILADGMPVRVATATEHTDNSEIADARPDGELENVD
jgi:multidrug efflux pump subunit AcrA (membrane-fusion protein)